MAGASWRDDPKLLSTSLTGSAYLRANFTR
jgi:hypothetical protein